MAGCNGVSMPDPPSLQEHFAQPGKREGLWVSCKRILWRCLARPPVLSNEVATPPPFSYQKVAGRKACLDRLVANTNANPIPTNAKV